MINLFLHPQINSPEKVEILFKFANINCNFNQFLKNILAQINSRNFKMPSEHLEVIIFGASGYTEPTRTSRRFRSSLQTLVTMNLWLKWRKRPRSSSIAAVLIVTLLNQSKKLVSRHRPVMLMCPVNHNTWKTCN